MAPDHDPGTEGYQGAKELSTGVGTGGYPWRGLGFRSYEDSMDALEEEQEKQARILGMRRLPDDLERLPPTIGRAPIVRST
jgi:hypothetical protein